MPRFLSILIGASLLGGCAYFPTPPDPIRIVDSPADVAACRRLGRVSGPVPTNGTAPLVISSLTAAIRSPYPQTSIPAPAPPSGPGFVYSLNAMRDAALALGATDLFLRRVQRDWSYVEGIAYRCRH
jgi:hypothetical protein